MKTFLKKIIVFLILPVIIYIPFSIFALPRLLSSINGPSTKDQITYSFEKALSRNYDLLILGNSRLYRGINPDVMTINSYNFSHDNDSYNQLYYKMRYLDSKGVSYKYLILSVDYFQFSFISNTRNYVYGSLLHSDYLKDYRSLSDRYAYFNYYLNSLNPKQLRALSWSNQDIPFIKDNGQFIRHGAATESDLVKRDITRLDIQVTYFEKILERSMQNDVKVFLLMIPTRENELKSYATDKISEFNSYIEKHTNESVILLDYTHDETYTKDDYTDITHLTQEAADRFSLQLDQLLLKHIEEEKMD